MNTQFDSTRRKFATFAKTPPATQLYPKIDLVRCWLCSGRGYVPSVRAGKPCRERCIQCSGNGSIVSDSAA